MKKKKVIKFALLALFTIYYSLFTSSCSHDESPIPNLLTDMVDLYTTADGTTSHIILDNGKRYSISNPGTGYHKNATYRFLINYVPADSTAEIYSLTGAYPLRDSVNNAKTNPTKVLSVWRTNRYINLHLAPLTQGGRQYWGFITDSVRTITASDGTTQHHAYVSLHHNQNGDPTSYTTDVYASLPIDSIKYSVPLSKKQSISRTDAITLRINTFDGQKTFDL